MGDYSTGGVGNFIELLNFRVRAGDTFLANHLNNAQKNATYISKETQNDLIECFGEIILYKIVNEVNCSKFFSILADEATDCSNKEQMSLVLRFVDQQNIIREDFIGFLHCKWGLSGADLSKVILSKLNTLGLDIHDCRGQGYDGAGAVAGRINGLSSHILRLNRKAIYTHCHSHRLNLVISKSCSVQLVRNVLLQVKELSYFFNLSPMRQQLLEKNVLKYCPESTRSKLKDVCRTQWIEKVTGMDTFQELFVAICYTLEQMSINENKEVNRETSDKALNFLKLISSFSFLISLVVTRSVFDHTLDVTKLLQTRNMDVIGGLELIETLKNEY